jgi:hypothetical protein
MMTLRRVPRYIAIASVITVSLAGGVNAQEEGELPWKRGALSVGGFFTNSDSSLRIDSATLGRGTEIDLESLGIDTTVETFRVDGFWRFLPRHRLDFGYYDLSRSSGRTLSKTIQVGDKTFVAGASVATEFDLAIIKAGYSYSFVQNPRFDLAANLGIFGLDTQFKISAAGIGSHQTSNLFIPLPVLGLSGSYALTPRFFARARVQYFGIDLGNVSGSWLDIGAGVDYDLFDHVAIGVAYDLVDLDVDVDRSNFRGSLDLGYGGIFAFVKVFY